MKWLCFFPNTRHFAHVADMIRLTMIDIESVISATKDVAACENAARYAGKPQLEVEAPKL